MNLELFCWRGYENPKRYPGITQPFDLGDGWEYATDGRICVRVPSNVKALASGVPPAGEVFTDFEADLCTEPWPAQATHVQEGKCPACEEPIGLALGSQTVGGRRIGGFYWWLVNKLPDVRFNPAGGPDDPIQLVSGELQGVLMPLGKRKSA